MLIFGALRLLDREAPLQFMVAEPERPNLTPEVTTLLLDRRLRQHRRQLAWPYVMRLPSSDAKLWRRMAQERGLEAWLVTAAVYGHGFLRGMAADPFHFLLYVLDKGKEFGSGDFDSGGVVYTSIAGHFGWSFLQFMKRVRSRGKLQGERYLELTNRLE